MVDGAATLSALFYGLTATGGWSEQRGTNMLDGGAPFYDAYETADGKYVTVGSIEPQFYAELLDHLGVDVPHEQMDRANWPALKERIAAIFKTKTRDEWCALLDNTDACFAPVLTLGEAPDHPHARARNSFVELAGVVQPAPAPRFDRTRAEVRRPPAAPGEHTEELLEEYGFTSDEIDRLRDVGAVASYTHPAVAREGSAT
jgi:alpha-methylacyl-CoA racemase